MNTDTGSRTMKDAKDALDAPRLAVANALQQAGITLKEASRALGRNDAYLQQYLYRGSPRRLPEDIRYALAELVGCDQRHFLGPNEIERQVNATLRSSALALADPLAPSFRGPDRAERQAMANMAGSTRASITFMDITASAGGGALIDGAAGDEAGSDDSIAMPVEMLRKITPTPSAGLRLITISGDSMAPVLEHGDVVMVDCTHTQPSPPGIFIVDDGVGLVAKRLDLVPATQPQMLRLTSENGVYTNYQRPIDVVHIVGRVVWFARTL
jgi:phage repressor protein C with HTH and peptisase S24 domain